jgi:hypothetical protein
MAPRAMVEALGWLATAVFVGSYCGGRPPALVRAQRGGALLWTVYGALVRAPPVVAANLLVLGAAAWKARRAGTRPDAAEARPDRAAPDLLRPCARVARAPR